LEILACAAMESNIEILPDSSLFCPMIDARRMEVFTALYDDKLQTILKPCALILDENSFANSLLNNQVLFFGNGAKKWSSICHHKNAIFIEPVNNALAMSKLAHQKYCKNDFANLAYSEPFYVKEFFNGGV
jgi:tRNA threonylcarbamoyladenosine biosynthesis protein TsaB